MATSSKTAAAGKQAKKKVNISDQNLLLIITIVIFLVMYLGAIIFLGGGFRNAQNLFNILMQQSALIITACGMSLVMITGGIDISVGGVVALVCMSCAVCLDYMGGNVPLSILVALGIGLAYGVVQGFLVAYLEIQPFIISLAGMFFARGMTTIVHSQPFNVENEAFQALKSTRIIVPGMGNVNRLGNYVDAYINIGVIIALLVVVLLFVMLRWTKLGRAFYAVGGNSQSALMLGINVKRTKFIAHLMCSILAGIAGYAFFLYVGSGSPSHAQGMEMDAIACLLPLPVYRIVTVALSVCCFLLLLHDFLVVYRLRGDNEYSDPIGFRQMYPESLILLFFPLLASPLLLSLWWNPSVSIIIFSILLVVYTVSRYVCRFHPSVNGDEHERNGYLLYMKRKPKRIKI